jgi:hypothetical protein
MQFTGSLGWDYGECSLLGCKAMYVSTNVATYRSTGQLMIRNLLHVQQFALLFQQLLWQLCRACNQTQYNRGAIKMMFVVPKVKPKVLLFSRLFYRVVQ